ncbi:hypothetical protein [Microbulbifer agarilyticus]|uniref:hypothetical protein n=1 Tax=Microbulbifer agarilyticus TaxID=260552 RepID=UPI0012F9BCD6|nr:hypothetical protein [Microbulbifer agarilyticus]
MTKDKLIILGIIFGFVWFSVSSWFPTPEAKDVVRSAIGISLCVCLYLGYAWSRWVLGVLSLIAVVFGVIIVAANSANLGGNSVAVLALMLCFYGYAAFYLLNPKLLQSHFK